MKDKNGKTLEEGQSVIVPDPDYSKADIHNHSFVGTVVRIRRNGSLPEVLVEDQEGFVVCIEPERLEIEEE